MKRQTLYELIKAHFLNDNKKFLSATKEISRQLFDLGDKQLSLEINKIIRNHSKLVTSTIPSIDMVLNEEQAIFMKIINRGFNNGLLNKVFLYGKPGTGKTLFAQKLSFDIGVSLKKISLSQVIDSKFGESMKLLDKVFLSKNRQVIFIDEIDSIASTRGVKNDIFEVSRILNHLLQLIDSISTNNLLIVATNMQSQIDSAFLRRFDVSLNFDNYSVDDIVNIFDNYSDKYKLDEFKVFKDHFQKLVIRTYKLWTPGYIRRAIQVSSLWLQENELPNNQIIEIIKLLEIGNNKNEIRDKLTKYNVPLRTIKYFVGGKYERISKI